MPIIRLIELIPWISVMRTMQKPISRLWISNIASVDGTHVDAQVISALTVHRVNRDRIGRAVIPFQTRNLVRRGIASTPSWHRASYWGGTRLCRISKR